MRGQIFWSIRLANAWMLTAGEEPPLAAHLITPRRGYMHHGLYLGEGHVVHCPGPVGGGRCSAVEEVSLAQFARGHAVRVCVHTQRFEREVVVRRGRSRLSENRHHLLRNNCEHFCEWCLNGVSRSAQVKSVLRGAAVLRASRLEARGPQKLDLGLGVSQLVQLWHDPGVLSAFSIIVRLAWDLIQWCGLLFRPRESLEAEILFLRRQLALYRERGMKPRRVDAATRVMLTLLSRCFDWRSALVVVQPETLIRWHRAGFRLWWRWKSRPGRPPIPKELRELIRRMARENPGWGQERIANELLLKLGLQVSPRTVAKYMPRPAPGRPRGDQRWSTFLRNHARAVIACDFCVAVTSTFRVLYVLVVIEHHSRRLIHFNVTAHPTAQWTRQQLREAVGYEERYEYLLHDRDSIFSAEVDASIQRLGLRVLKSPPRSPKANSICERVLGTLRRECLDWLIPLSESHLRQTLNTWVAHYNRGRPHSALGPGVPAPPANSTVPLSKSRHRLDDFRLVQANPILAGLHHEYSLARA